jgi:hypothetical protein
MGVLGAIRYIRLEADVLYDLTVGPKHLISVLIQDVLVFQSIKGPASISMLLVKYSCQRWSLVELGQDQ